MRFKSVRQNLIYCIHNLHYEKFQDGTEKYIEDEIPFEVPEGWEWDRLSNIASFSGGKTPSTSNPVFWNGDILWVTSKDMKSKYIESSQLMLSNEGALQMQLYPVGTVLMVARSGILRHTLPIAILRKKATVNQDIKAISLYEYKLSEWLYTCLKGMEKNILLKYTKSGTTVENINFDEFKNLLLPIPPVKEIIRIISQVQNAIDATDVIENTEKDLFTLIDSTKSKILDLAIRGKLVEQDSDDEPTSVLLDRIRNEKETLIKQGKLKRDKKESIIYKGDDNSYYERSGKKEEPIDDILPFEIPKTWTWCRLGSICTEILYGLSNSAEASGTHRLLRITDIQNGNVNWSSVPFTTTDDEKYLLKENDIVFARTGATVGKSFLIKNIPVESVYASYLIRIRLLPGIDAEYIYDFFNSPFYWQQITDKAVGVGQPNCNGTLLQELLIPLPPANEQKQIQRQVSRYNAEISNIEVNLE